MDLKMFNFSKSEWIIVLTVGFGYFVDAYDLLLYSAVRVKSLTELGLSADEIKIVGLNLLNWQIAGVVIGGFTWGILADKFGRVSTLFASILLYSLANLLNGFIDSVEQYRILRFIAGLGLAGELGTGISLIVETLSPQKRGNGTMIVAFLGMLGVITAAYLAKTLPSWRTTYIIGAGMGFTLLLIRLVKLNDAAMFKKIRNSEILKGDLRLLFLNKERIWRYFRCLMVGLPTYFIIGVLVTFAPEFGKLHGLIGENAPTAYDAMIIFYLSLAVSDIVLNYISQKYHSRKLPILISLTFQLVGGLVFLLAPIASIQQFYACYILLGIGLGYWGLTITFASETFGTNLRATVATSTPTNFRGLLLLITPLYTWLIEIFDKNIGSAALVVILVCILIATASTLSLKETFGRDLDFQET